MEAKENTLEGLLSQGFEKSVRNKHIEIYQKEGEIAIYNTKTKKVVFRYNIG